MTCVGVVEEEALSAVGRVSGEGGDQRRCHEAVHEIELLGAGDSASAGEAERKGVAGDRPGRALHGDRRLHIQLPCSAVILRPPHPAHPPSSTDDNLVSVVSSRSAAGAKWCVTLSPLIHSNGNRCKKEWRGIGLSVGPNWEN